MLVQPVPDELIATVIAESVKVPAFVWTETLRGILDSDPTALLKRITAPTLLVWGGRDVVVGRREQDLLERRIVGAQLCVHEGVGHHVHWEQPDEVTAQLVGFVERVTN